MDLDECESEGGDRDVSVDGQSFAGSDDPPITPDYLNTLTFLQVKRCSSCSHSSNEYNPLKQGSFKASAKFPCWPWLHGTHISPSGNFCRICEWTFGLANFNMKYSTVAEMQNAQQKSATETEEFLACAKKTIELVNNGRFKAPRSKAARESIAT